MSDNLFDGLRDSTFDVVANTMGKKAVSWTPLAGGPAHTSDCLFNDPNSLRKLGDVEYLPTNTLIEYRKPFFPGLKESADLNNTEYVVIGEDTYYVRTVHATWDGNTLVAILEKN
jgi:hypothetical protein